jgi:predicted CoA-binding protein
MNQAILDFIECKRLAVIGASRKGDKFGNTVSKELRERGYQVFIGHPEANENDGEPCYPNLAKVMDKVDGVFVYVPAAQATGVFHQASEAGLRNVWLQQQAEIPKVIELGKELDLDVVYGKCILMYALPVHSYHAVHRFFVNLFGQL